MTREELNKLPFHMVYHASLSDKHVAIYLNIKYKIFMYKITKKKDDYTFGRTLTHYEYQGKVYKSLPKFLEVIKDI